MANSERVKKRVRASNFNAAEEALLMALIKKYCHIIECKKTDALSNKQKEHGWDKLHAEFNAQSGAHARTVVNLKAKFDNLKRNVKKVLMDEKKERFKTGGGSPVIPTLNAKTEILLEVMGVGLEGMRNPYDNNRTGGKLLLHLLTVQTKQTIMT
jgi:Myb/SANT-like DNA-binding domain